MSVTLGAQQLLTFSDEEEVGGQTFNKFPESGAETAQFWALVWGAIAAGITAPAPPNPGILAASILAWENTQAPLSEPPTVHTPPPGTGIIAISAAATAAFASFASIAPPNVVTPPPAPLAGILAGALAPFIIGVTDPVAPAFALAGAVGTWIATATFTPPGGSPTPFAVAP